MGFLLRKSKIVKHIGKLLNIVIMILLFFLGVSVGNNEQVINNIAIIGVDALILTFGGLFGSLLFAKMIYKRFFVKTNRDLEKSSSSKVKTENNK